MDWPQFRGPNRNGVATAFSAPKVWPEQLTRKWKIDVGQGDATPILVRDRLYVFTRQGDNEVMQAIDAAAGDTIWQASYAQSVSLNHRLPLGTTSNITMRVGSSGLAEPDVVWTAPNGSKNVPPAGTSAPARLSMAKRTRPSST